MSPDEIQSFTQSIGYHQPVAIGSFLLFTLIYRSKFFAHKERSSLQKQTTIPETEKIDPVSN